MEFEDEAFLLAARPFGEGAAIAELLCREQGLFAAHIAGGGGRRMRPLLQVGTRLRVRYRSRLESQLGSATVEAEGPGPAALFSDPAALAGLASAAAVVAGALPERAPHPRVFAAFAELIGRLSDPRLWPPVYVRFEAGLLEELGFGLDLLACAATGSTDDLVFVSPRTGRAVSAAAGEPWRDRLLALPPFLLSAQSPLQPGDIAAGLRLTGVFLANRVFGGLGRPLPPARLRLAEMLAGA